jgi:hypothetical protein
VTELVVCCFYWIDNARKRSYQFTPEDVRIWDSMIARNLTIPHRRVCITHRPDLIDFMETVPLDMAKHVPGTCAVKLMAWRPDIESVLGPRILSMDIDCVVTGNLDPLVDRPEDVVLWKNPNFIEGGRRGFYQGSMQLLTAGARPFIWTDFDPNSTPSWLNRRFGGAEQAWISERLNTSFPNEGWEWNEAHWTEESGVYGAGRLVAGQMGAGVQSELPENARIVFVPGDRVPGQSHVQQTHPWIKEHWH